MKEPINTQELQEAFNSKNNFNYEGFLSYNKFRVSPTAAFRYAGPSRIRGVLNTYYLENCLIIIERSTCTSINFIEVEAGKQLIDKCIEKNMKPKFIVPGTSFSFSDPNAEPGAPIEIKFYFYNAPKAETAEEGEKLIKFTINKIIDALRTVYAFEDIEVSKELIESVLKNESVYFKIEMTNEKTHMVGKFVLDTAT
jgi:hypothetical protein